MINRLMEHVATYPEDRCAVLDVVEALGSRFRFPMGMCGGFSGGVRREGEGGRVGGWDDDMFG